MTKFELEHLLCIGEFHLSTGILEICDPSVNDFLCSDIPISALNQSTVVMRNCPSGQYRVYYEIDQHGVPVSLICHPSIVSYEDILEHDASFNYTGSVIPQISHSICIIDSMVHNDASACVREIEPDAYYDPQALLDLIKSCPYPPDVRNDLVTYLKKCIESCENASGSALLSFSKRAGHYWSGYHSGDVPSSHWACDIASRISGSLPACNIMGGVVARTGRIPLCKVFLLRGRMGTVTAIRIFLVDDNEISPNGSIRSFYS